MRCRCKLLWLLWCGSVFAYLQLQWRGLSNVVLRHDLAEKPPPMSEVPHKDMLRAMVKNMHEISWKIFCEANPHLVFHGFTAKTGLRLKTILQAGQKLGIFGALQDFLWLFQITLLRFESFRINDRIDRRFFLQRNKQVTESWLLPIASASLCRWNRWNLQWPAVEDAAFVTVVSRQGRDVIYFRHHSFVRLGSELMQVSKGFEQFGNVKICWPEQLFRVCNWSSKKYLQEKSSELHSWKDSSFWLYRPKGPAGDGHKSRVGQLSRCVFCVSSRFVPIRGQRCDTHGEWASLHDEVTAQSSPPMEP